MFSLFSPDGVLGLDAHEEAGCPALIHGKDAGAEVLPLANTLTLLLSSLFGVEVKVSVHIRDQIPELSLSEQTRYLII